MMSCRDLKDWVRLMLRLIDPNRHRLLSEVGRYLKLSPAAVYRIGEGYLKNRGSEPHYDDPKILCRYVYVGVEPRVRSYGNLFRIVAAGKVLDYGSGVGLQFDEIRDSERHVKCFLDIPGPAFDFIKWKYPGSVYIEAPTDEIGEDYALICVTDVLEHVADPVSITRRILAAIRPGGYILYHFNENPHKPGHLVESIRQKPMCDALIRDACNFVQPLGEYSQYELWRKQGP